MPSPSQHDINDRHDREVVSLRDYFDNRIHEVQLAISVAHAAMEKRLDGMNEFRQALRDQTSMMVTRADLEAHRERNDVDLRRLEVAISEVRIKFGTLVGVLVGSGVLGGAVGGVLAKLL